MRSFDLIIDLCSASAGRWRFGFGQNLSGRADLWDVFRLHFVWEPRETPGLMASGKWFRSFWSFKLWRIKLFSIKSNPYWNQRCTFVVTYNLLVFERSSLKMYQLWKCCWAVLNLQQEFHLLLWSSKAHHNLNERSSCNWQVDKISAEATLAFKL